MTQLNYTLSELFILLLNQTQLWTMLFIHPNNSGFPNSFDKCHVKAQLQSLLIPDMIVSCRSIKYHHVTNYSQSKGIHYYYMLSHQSIWLSYGAWKTVEDGLRVVEKGQHQLVPGGGMDEDDKSVVSGSDAGM